MARFFFHRTDGYREADHEGTELANVAEARKRAVMYAGETLRDQPDIIWDGEDLKIEVTDDAGALMLVVIVLTIDSPMTSRKAVVGEHAS